MVVVVEGKKIGPRHGCQLKLKARRLRPRGPSDLGAARSLARPSVRPSAAAASIEGVDPVSGALHQFDIDLEDNWVHFKRRTERL